LWLFMKVVKKEFLCSMVPHATVVFCSFDTIDDNFLCIRLIIHVANYTEIYFKLWEKVNMHLDEKLLAKRCSDLVKTEKCFLAFLNHMRTPSLES
jgi:hypothetical protein